jgi:hypothetical protein
MVLTRLKGAVGNYAVVNVCRAGKPKVASMLYQDVKGAFNNVSHARSTHDLRKRRIPYELVY